MIHEEIAAVSQEQSDATLNKTAELFMYRAWVSRITPLIIQLLQPIIPTLRL